MHADTLPLLLSSAVSVCALAVAVTLALLADKRESQLRRKLGAARTSREAAESERDRCQRILHAQSVELARYRGRLPPDSRLTQVVTIPPPLPEPTER